VQIGHSGAELFKFALLHHEDPKIGQVINHLRCDVKGRPRESSNPASLALVPAVFNLDYFLDLISSLLGESPGT
jgi:hypothetical protein